MLLAMMAKDTHVPNLIDLYPNRDIETNMITFGGGWFLNGC